MKHNICTKVKILLTCVFTLNLSDLILLLCYCHLYSYCFIGERVYSGTRFNLYWYLLLLLTSPAPHSLKQSGVQESHLHRTTWHQTHIQPLGSTSTLSIISNAAARPSIHHRLLLWVSIATGPRTSASPKARDSFTPTQPKSKVSIRPLFVPPSTSHTSIHQKPIHHPSIYHPSCI